MFSKLYHLAQLASGRAIKSLDHGAECLADALNTWLSLNSGTVNVRQLSTSQFFVRVVPHKPLPDVARLSVA